jgi:hypothetical protein
VNEHVELSADQNLIARLAAHRTVGAAPADQLLWLAERGVLRRFPANAVALMADLEMESLWVHRTSNEQPLRDCADARR